MTPIRIAPMLAVALLGISVVAAQQAPAPAEPVAEAETPEPVEQISTFKVGKVKGLDTIIQDLSIREMELTKAVRNLALMSGVNITVGKDVDGTVSCNLRNITVRQALDATGENDRAAALVKIAERFLENECTRD